MLCHNPAIKEKIFQMDSIDRKILAELQADGRLSITELAERVNLSLSLPPATTRAGARGVITGYRANLDPGKMGFNYLAIVFATLKEGDKKRSALLRRRWRRSRRLCWRNDCLAIRTI